MNARSRFPVNARIDILRTRYLDGPNHWTYRPVLEAVVDIGALEDFPSNLLPGYPQRLAAWLPGLEEHRCSVGERGGFLSRLAEGTWPAHIIEHVALELQTLTGLPTGFGRARETSTRGVYKVAIHAPHDAVATRALHLARDLVMAAMCDAPFDVDAAVACLQSDVDAVCLGPGTTAIVAAASARGIPVMRLNDANLVQLGFGSRQRRAWTAETDATNAIAEGIARNRALTRRLLALCGLPVPEARAVTSAAQAWAAAQELGLPVVVKPEFGDHGRGVCMHLSLREEVEAAFRIASAVQDEDDEVEIQRYIPGSEHRLLVVRGSLVAALRGVPAAVTGDGRSDIASLVERQLNSDPRRGDRERHPLAPIRLDAATRLELTRQGLRPESVPAAGTRVVLRWHGNLSEDVTDIVHPEIVAMALLAVRVTGLDIAGVDVVAEDIAAPVSGQAAAVIGVSAGPALQPHLWPGAGKTRPVGQAIIDHLFADGEHGRIPLVGITGTHGLAPLGRLITDLMQLKGTNAGLADGKSVQLGGRRLATADDCPWTASRQLLMNTGLDAAVVVNDLPTMARHGLAYDRCQVGVVTGFDPTALLPELDIESAEDLWKVLRTQVDVVLPEGVAVLDADNTAVLDLAPLCDGEVILFGETLDNAALAAHRRQGGRTVFFSEGRLVLAAGTWETVALYPRQLQRALEARPLLPPKHLLAAMGAAWALGITDEVLTAAFALPLPQREVA